MRWNTSIPITQLIYMMLAEYFFFAVFASCIKCFASARRASCGFCCLLWLRNIYTVIRTLGRALWGFPLRDNIILADLMIVFLSTVSPFLCFLFFCLIATSPAQPPCVWADHKRALMTSSCVEDKVLWVKSRSRLYKKKKKRSLFGHLFSASADH